MRRLLASALALTAVLYALPLWMSPAQEPDTVQSVVQTNDSLPSDNAATAAAVESVTVSLDGTPTTLALEDYVEGVVAAEISNDFPIEAIRAQAVAARTYAVYKVGLGRPDAHPDADLCDDYTHCAAYRDPAVQTAAGDDLSRIRQAVQDTAGEILTYDGAPIAAVFHCASGPRTESAANVWGEDIPYLQSAVSPGGSACPEYEDTVSLSADAFRQTVSQAFPTADVSGPPSSWFKNSDRSAAGGIITVQLGGVTVEGTAVRELFGLHSTNFTITCDDDSISFHTIGYGHGVGLSQYGAKYMAEQGSDYAEILAHYYAQTTLTHV